MSKGHRDRTVARSKKQQERRLERMAKHAHVKAAKRRRGMDKKKRGGQQEAWS